MQTHKDVLINQTANKTFCPECQMDTATIGKNTCVECDKPKVESKEY